MFEEVGLLQTSLTPQQLRQLSPTSLAYLGDAVYELYVRQRYLFPPRRTHRYHQQVVAQVRAERQAEQLHLIETDLTDEERDVIRRGRNATVRPPKRLDPKTYQEATGLEALIGYLYLTDSERLFELLSRFNFED
ncbi:Mini-ribonuclease 3 [Sodalinema gerasimenkoae]|uniref:Mini-ribonuclease 3 n=1 Tax=Sodalinema gerasimenkoae TaxID=2862348 RepID=UPI00135B117C|nr:ribonuclease III domain-containing protein [Sodalinema gerasimenkoae]